MEAGRRPRPPAVISELQCAPLTAPLHRPAGAAGGLVAAVEHVGDVVDLLGAWGGVAGGGPQIDVTGRAETACTGAPASRQRVAQ